MTDPRNIAIKDYLYDLPENKIAEFPLRIRDHSKLLVFKRGTSPLTYHFKDIAEHLPGNSLLILNDTRVIHARLLFQKISGARVEVFCLNPYSPVKELHTAFSLPSPVTWECLIGNARRWKTAPLTLTYKGDEEEVSLKAEKLKPEIDIQRPSENSSFPVKFSWTPDKLTFSEVLERFGTIPLPPYIKRKPETRDNKTYQTVYALQEGSVAAPTAGLHFTPLVFHRLEEKNIRYRFLTLHVGAGTFKPVTSARVGDHLMHAEPFEITADLLRSLLVMTDRPIIAVGTTSVRTLESIYHAGLSLLHGNNNLDNLVIQQWSPYENASNSNFPRTVVLQGLLDYMDKKHLSSLSGYTRLLIAPGYHFGFVDGMVTNFHQPGSTLLLLISAFLGEEWRKVYQYALNEDYRFLSYGDSCLFL